MSRFVLLALACSAIAAAQSDIAANPCVTVKCSAGFVCQSKDGVAGCVKEPYPVTLNACAVTLCTVGSVCVEEGGVAKCVPPPEGINNCTLPFEEWKQCAECEPSCDNRTPFCTKMCKPASCQCRRGFFRSKEGHCVTQNECDIVATAPSTTTCSRKNEEYKECASACEPTCKTKDQERACIAMCKPAACECKVGFYRAENGGCVTASECTATPECKRNEAFLACSSMCEPQCGQYGPLPCFLMCGPPKCQCTSGFYRNANGHCMTRAECEKTPTPPKPVCKKNQIYTQCSSVCVPKCGEYEVRTCMSLMCGPPKCECARGFYLNRNGQCVTRKECDEQSATPKTPSQADCKPNEKFTECSTMCEEKCGEPLTRPCPASCGPAKCECDIGFFRNSVGDCVSKSDCDVDTPITCANIDCASGMICQMKEGKPTCEKPTLTCNTVKCGGGHRCEISPDGTPSCIPNLTCANLRCAGPCTDTPSGPQCGPRPQVLPISVGPTSAPGCPTNEEIRECTNKCNEPFCGDEDYARRCAQVCLTPECECKEGFVRDGKKGCVQREHCTKEEAVSPCARKNCGIAASCVDDGGRAKCVPLFGDNEDSQSDSLPASPPSVPSLPDSCDQVTCLGGGICVMEEVKCISGPCKRVPKCNGGPSTGVAADASVDQEAPSSGFGSVYQPYADNCSQLQCKEGEECTMERVPCFTRPCKKMAMCRPANTICHKEHEVWDQCFHGCGSTCQHRDPSCTEQCGPGGCICDTFYIRDEVSGNCVRLEECPSNRAIPIKKPRALTVTTMSSDTPIGLPPVPPPTCDNFDCPVGQMCILPPMACPVPPCTRRPTCVKDPSFLPGDEIVPTCEGHSCPAGQKCQLQQVQCIRAPCYPIPACVPDMVPPTCNLPCPYGETCVLETVFCKKAPCPQKPSCRLLQVDPVPTTCAAVTCQFGQKCVLEPLPCFIAPCPNRAICRPSNQTCNKKNEKWSQCFTGCEATCQTRMKACTYQCGPGGCQCNSGFIRNEITGECIPESQCPNNCAANEKYDRCFHGCEATCEEATPLCTKQCRPGGCRCADGLVRDMTTNKCIQQSSCPRRN